MELEPGNPDFVPNIDNRPRVPEPLPVKLVAVEDVSLPAPVDIEEKLDAFYGKLLQFERDRAEPGWVYRADNVSLRFVPTPRVVVHDSLRPVGIIVPSLPDTINALIHAEIEYTRQRGVMPGQDSLLLLDPAGNWVELMEERGVL